jgi:hypothetical protein
MFARRRLRQELIGTLVATLVLLSYGLKAEAASVTAGTASGLPGATVSFPVTLNGDVPAAVENLS